MGIADPGDSGPLPILLHHAVVLLVSFFSIGVIDLNSLDANLLYFTFFTNFLRFLFFGSTYLTSLSECKYRLMPNNYSHAVRIAGRLAMLFVSE